MEAATAPPIVKPTNRTRARLEAKWQPKEERQLARGTYSISQLAKLSAGEYARRLISNEPNAVPPYLGWAGNKMGDAILNDMGVQIREVNLPYHAGQISLSGHPDGVDADYDAGSMTVVECKRFTFPTPATIEQAKRQALAYAGMLRDLLNRHHEAGSRLVTLDMPAWAGGGTVNMIPGNYAWHVQIAVAGAFEPEIIDVPATPELLTTVLADFVSKAKAVHESVLKGDLAAAQNWDAAQAKERPVEDWANPPQPVEALLKTLADVKTNADTWAAQEEAVRAELRDAMRAANIQKAIGAGLSASWVQKKTTDPDQLEAALRKHGRGLTDFEKERVVREVDQAALAAFMGSVGLEADTFKTKVYQESFTVRAVGRKKKEAPNQ